MNGWYGRPVAAACAALAAIAASLYILAGAEYGSRESTVRRTYSVTIRHDGVDARAMERSVAVPLEDALASIPGVVEVSSESEYGKALAMARLSAEADGEGVYEAIRDAARAVYERLSPSADRPEIVSASEGRGPAWIAAVNSDLRDDAELGRLLERAVKPALEKLPGAGSVELAGAGIPEILVEVDDLAASALGLSPEATAWALANSDRLVPAGTLESSGVESAIMAEGRFGRSEDLATASLRTPSGALVALGSFARVETRERPPEALSRVDGLPAVTVAVMPGGGANLAALSRAIARETAALSSKHGLRFKVLSDAGAELASSFNSTLAAAGKGALAVAIAAMLLVGSGRRHEDAGRNLALRARLAAVAAVPATLLMSAAALSALGLGLDRHAFAGLVVGLGASVDAALLSAERLGGARGFDEGKAAMRELIPSLASGTATTLVALVPLASLDFLSEGIASVAAAIAAACVFACVIAALFMPPLVLGRIGFGRRSTPRAARGADTRRPRGLASGKRWLEARFGKLSRLAARALRRSLAANARLCDRRPFAPLCAAFAVSAGGALAITIAPTRAEGAIEGNVVFARAEFAAGTAATVVDERLAEFSLNVSRTPGVEAVLSTARRGSGSALARFDPGITDREAIASACRRIGVPGGFVWVPEPSSGERSWSLSVYGDDDELCRRLAERVAAAVSSLPFAIDVVLDFKEGPEDLILRPDRERASDIGVGFIEAAMSLRRGAHGPVAYKRIGPGGETDVRVMARRAGSVGSSPGGGLPAIAELASLIVAPGSGRAGSLMRFSRERDVARIHRRDRRRVASITMRSLPIDPPKARDAAFGALAQIELPPGYSVEFDREAMEAEDRLRGLGVSFVAAAVLGYMAIAFITESFGTPLAVLSALPPSMAVPALLMLISGMPMDVSIACAFVAVSGIAVNASVLVVDERRSDIARSSGLAGFKNASSFDLYRMTRARLGSLAATSGTTVAGALPLILLSGSGDTLARAMAFVTAAGTTASFVVALTVVPAIARAAPHLFLSFQVSRHDKRQAVGSIKNY